MVFDAQYQRGEQKFDRIPVYFISDQYWVSFISRQAAVNQFTSLSIIISCYEYVGGLC